MVKAALVANFTPAVGTQQDLTSAVDQLLQLYPNEAALGSPFNTGNETFGLSPAFKQAAAIS